MAVLERQVTAGAPGDRAQSRAAQLRDRLMVPVDPGSLMLFRIGFGALMVWEAWRFFNVGFIRDYYLEPDILFTWWGLDWVRPSDPGIYVHFAIFGVAAAGVALGIFYRFSATVVWLALLYMFLLDKSRYLNHVYLATIIAFLLILVPAHVGWSLDARRKPWLRSRTIPTWPVWLLRFQVGVPYFFAGVAKLNADWIVRNEPLREWLLKRMDFPLIGHFFANDIATRTMAWGSAALDLSVPFLMLNRKTRAPAYGLAIGFHFLNSRLFAIGVFPWMMIVVTTIFFDYDWPKQMIATLRSGTRLARAAIAAGAVVGGIVALTLPRFKLSPVMGLVGAFGVAVFVFHMLPERLRLPAPAPSEEPVDSPWRKFSFRRPLALFLVVWAAVQLLLPVRHFFIPGNVHWSDEGHRFSWHMLLRQKTGWAVFHITYPKTGETWTEDPFKHMTREQNSSMAVRPDLIVQFAHYLEGYYRDLGLEDIEVRVETQAWLNSRIPQEFVDPNIDLTEVKRPLIPPIDWLIPLEPVN